jgi:hypothetical protein
MQFSTAVTTTVRTLIPKKVYDTVTLGTPGLMTFLRTSKEWKTGYQYQPLIKYQDTTNGGVTGVADQLDSDRQNVRVNMTFNPKMAYKPVVVADIEQTLNMGDEQIVNLLDTEFDSQGQSLCNLMAAQLYTGNGTGNQWDSLLNAASDSTLFSTYAGLSRSTYTSINGYYLAATGAITLAKLATGFDATTVGMDEPDVLLTTKTLWSSYEALLTPTLRATYQGYAAPNYDQYGMRTAPSESMLGTQGFRAITYRGAPVVKDEQVPSGKLFYVNTKYFGMRGIQIKGENYQTLNFKKTSDGTPAGVPGNVPSAKGFNFRVMMAPVNQLSQVGYLTYAGDFVSENPRLLGTLAAAS